MNQNDVYTSFRSNDDFQSYFSHNLPSTGGPTQDATSSTTVDLFASRFVANKVRGNNSLAVTKGSFKGEIQRNFDLG